MSGSAEARRTEGKTAGAAAGTDPADAAGLAVWYKTLRERTNETFFPLYADEHRYLILMGGGGSGKSIFAGQKIIERVTSEPGHRWLVVRKVGRTLRQSCWKQLVGQIGEYCPGIGKKLNLTDMVISFENGSEILFSGLDDAEKLKSIYNITGIWIEEASELSESDFNQLDIRLRGETRYYKQIIATFNPVSVTHWLKARFFDPPPTADGRQDPRVRVHRSTYRDNRFLDAENIRVLESFREIDEYYYQVYCLGMWGVTGKTVFDSQAVTKRLLEHVEPARTGRFVYEDDGLRLAAIRFEDDPHGFIKVYKPPEPGVPYVLGGDTAGEGSDCFVAQVLDNRTGEQVCVLRMRTDEDLYAKQVFALGSWYNNALAAIETNLSTYPVMELERLSYPNQYVRETMDDYTHQLRHTFGFRTDSKTRPVIIAELIRAVREDVGIVCDGDTLGEMLTFVRNENYRPEAEQGAHDDCVMALAIAHHARQFQSVLREADAGAETEWSESMREDYHRATAEEREIMMRKWGKPKRM